jgi:DNA (cytosine-5)-methyltransferase 1
MKVLDLFSGIGGFSLGLERAGMETVAFCEIEEYPRKVLAKHWPDVPIYNDVRELTNERLRADGITGIDVICGGFPCQDISTAGNQAGIGEGTRSGLWSECARLLGDIRPRYAIFENVTALLSGDSGRWFEQVLWDISQVGYDAEWHCIPASELGAHHHRDRVWIVAYSVSERQPVTRGHINAIGAKENPYREADWLVNAVQRDALPYVCRRHDGLSFPMDRLKALGNAVVPQIPELIGRAIMEAGL